MLNKKPSKKKKGLELLLKKDKKRWTEQEKEFLRKNAGSMSDEEIAETIHKTLRAIREMRYRLDLIKKSGRGIIELRDE